MSNHETRVRSVAYRIWEEAGRPIGQHEAHWTAALHRISRVDAKRAAERTAKDPGPAAPRTGGGREPGHPSISLVSSRA